MSVRVRRWSKYGRDRLYVDDAAGTPIGWVDLRTGRRHLEAHARARDLEDALAAHAPTTLAAPAAPAAPAALPARSSQDLAFRTPGQAARRMARSKWDEAPLMNLVSRLFGVRTSDRSWRVGARGEVTAARWLRRLPRGWRTLHSIPLARRDIDHLVVGPGGVFTINSKHHRDGNVWAAGDALFVNGQRRQYVEHARWEATHAARMLGRAVGRPVPVTGVVLCIGTRRMTVKEQPRDGRVLVSNPYALMQWMKRLPRRLSSAEVERIHAAARSAATWS